MLRLPLVYLETTALVVIIEVRPRERLRPFVGPTKRVFATFPNPLRAIPQFHFYSQLQGRVAAIAYGMNFIEAVTRAEATRSADIMRGLAHSSQADRHAQCPTDCVRLFETVQGRKRRRR
jgi:hypothetical protein